VPLVLLAVPAVSFAGYPPYESTRNCIVEIALNQIFKPDQRRARSEQTRENILDAALHCYQKQGVHNTAMEDVSRQAGIGRATLYRYFSNQEVLLTEVMSRNIEQLQQVIASSLKGCTRPEEYFVEAALTIIRECHERALTTFLFRDEASIPAVSRITFSPTMTAMGDTLIDPFYQRAKAEGILRDWVTKPLLQEWTSRLLLSFLTNPGTLLNTESKLRRFFYEAVMTSIVDRTETG
jgi:AcrR family transcriptional regulator